MKFLRKEVSPDIDDRFDGTEPESDFLRSSLLDLMNVKYVLASSDIRGRTFIGDLLREAFILPTSGWGIRRSAFLINGVQKVVLFQHPPSRIDDEITLRGQTHLNCALGLDPAVWAPDKGDGVVFQVDATSLSSAQELFSEYIDPKNRVLDRKWHVHSIDLSSYSGQEIYLIFQTSAPSNANFDWAHWAQLPGGIQESLRAQLAQSQIIAPVHNYVAPAELTIGGKKLETWGQHPPATVRFRIQIPNQRPILNFAIALDPAVWKPENGDGVTFEILAAPVQTIFSHAIDPKNNPQDRKWHPVDIDLTSFRDQRVLLSFHTLPEANNAFDWAGWGDLRLEAEEEQEEKDKFDLVYDREVKIYRNKDVLPRAFVVDHAEVIDDKNRILTRLTEPDFDPAKSVLLEQNDRNEQEIPNAASTEIPAGSAPVEFERYEPNYIRLHTTLSRQGYLLLTDAYYAGWKVRVDGKAGTILPADYIFRAVPLKPGSHLIEFIYHPTSFLVGLVISISAISLLLFLPLLIRARTCLSARIEQAAFAEKHRPGSAYAKRSVAAGGEIAA